MAGLWYYSLALAFLEISTAYWLMAPNNRLTTQRLDPVVSPGSVATHVHGVVGGSNFGPNTSTAALRDSSCSSIPLIGDFSNYWFPVRLWIHCALKNLNRLCQQLYFQWANGSFTSVVGNPVIYYLFNNTPGATTAFPDDFRMLSGDPTLRTLNASSFAQQAVTFLCLDFNGQSPRFNELPRGRSCPSGIRSQINFPSCWNGKDADSPDHKSHVTWLSTGPDNGTCTDENFPVTLPRIFMEVYWISQVFEDQRGEAMTPSQPFVFSNGDPTGYGYHADFFNGWNAGLLQSALDGCNCNPYGDPTCCVSAGIFSMNQSSNCFISDTVDEQTLGTLETLPGNNPVQAPCYQNYIDPITPPLLSPVYAYTASTDSPVGTTATPAQTAEVKQTADGSCIRKGSAGMASPWRSQYYITALVVLLFCVL